MNPKISVIIPTYNRKDLLPKAVQSVLAQTFKDYEILVVDHGSTDGTAGSLREKFGGAVKWISLPYCELPACPRNAGLREARGEWVAFLDSDDLWVPDKLEKQMAAARKDPEAALLYGIAESFDESGPRGFTVPPERARSGFVFNSLLLFNFIPILTVLLRRDVLDETGPFDTRPDLRAIEDYDLWLRIAYRHRVRFMPEVLARYRMHPHNLLGNPLPMYDRWERLLRKTFAEKPVGVFLRRKALLNLDYLRFKYRLVSRLGLGKRPPSQD